MTTEQQQSIIVDIPSITLPVTVGVAELVSRTEEYWDCAVNGIVYPGIWIEGLTTSSDRLFSDRTGIPGPPLDEVVKLCGEKNWSLWLDIDLDLKPVRSDLLHIKDFYGGSASHACVNSPATAQALGIILKELRAVTGGVGEGPLTGVVYSVQNLWPMSGEDVVELTCFCRYCRASLEQLHPGLLSHFQTIPNPWDLALRLTGTGISHIEQISSHSSPEELLALSRAGGFLAAQVSREGAAAAAAEQQLLQWTRYLLDYAKARHHLTFEAIKRMTQLARSVFGDAVVVAATNSDDSYDWTSGMFMAEIDQDPPVDEFWTAPSNDLSFMSAPHRFYLWERERYLLNDFFGTLEASRSVTQRTVSGLTDAKLHQHGILNMRKMLAGRLPAPMALDLLPSPSPANARGVVLVAIFPDHAQRLVEHFVPAPSEPTPEELLASLQALVNQRDDTEG